MTQIEKLTVDDLVVLGKEVKQKIKIEDEEDNQKIMRFNPETKELEEDEIPKEMMSNIIMMQQGLGQNKKVNKDKWAFDALPLSDEQRIDLAKSLNRTDLLNKKLKKKLIELDRIDTNTI